MNKPKPVLIISLDETGKIFVSGPLDNKTLCYNLISETIKIVTLFEAKPKPLVQPASVIPIVGSVGGNGK
jgi:hypothetical protein